MALYKKKSMWREMIASKLRKKPGNVWKDVAWRITRPRQNLAEVNLGKLDKITKEGETIVVPGKVLAVGEITHPITVGALSFSHKAKERIEKAGGKCLELVELAEQNPEGKGIRIIG